MSDLVFKFWIYFKNMWGFWFLYFVFILILCFKLEDFLKVMREFVVLFWRIVWWNKFLLCGIIISKLIEKLLVDCLNIVILLEFLL